MQAKLDQFRKLNIPKKADLRKFYTNSISQMTSGRISSELKYSGDNGGDTG